MEIQSFSPFKIQRSPRRMARVLSDGSGHYALPALPPGSYRITVGTGATIPPQIVTVQPTLVQSVPPIVVPASH